MRRAWPLAVVLLGSVGCGDDAPAKRGTEASSSSSSSVSSGVTTPDLDGDDDGYDAADDCDDEDAAVHPGATETCNGADDDCDGAIDDSPAGATLYYPDGDLDGYGSNSPVLSCSDPSTPGQPYVLSGGDCNDGDAAIHPLAEEVCDDGADNDCDGNELSGCGPCQVTVPTQQPTITAGLAAAAPGDRVCVLAGTYSEHVVMPAFPVELVGTDGRDVTFIEGDATKPVVVFSGGDASTRLAGFTIRNGKYELNTADASGIRVVGSPTLEDLVVELNDGTAVTFSSSTSTFRDSIIRNNHDGWHAGGIDVWDSADVLLEGLEMYGNDGNRAGAIYVENGSSAAIRNGIFHDNDGGYGGAIYVSGIGTTAEISNVLAYGNTSSYGGGLWVSHGAATLEHLALIANTGFSAAGMFVSDAATVTGEHVIVAGNSNGRAFVIEDGASVTLSHALVYRNPGGAARFNLGGSLTLADSIVAYNSAGISCWNPPCLLAGGNSALWNDTIEPAVQSSGFVALYPELVDTAPMDPMLWDLHLAPLSSVVDAGSMTDPDASPADLGPYGGAGADAWDIDGDGFPSWWQPGPYDAAIYPGLGLDCDDRDAGVYPGSGC